MKSAAEPRGWYLAREVGLLAGVSGDKIGQWARYGYIRSSWSSTIPRVYSFQDVAEAIAVHQLLDRGVMHADIKQAIDGLRETHGDWPLQMAQLVTTNRKQASARVAIREGETAYDVGRRRGQAFLSFVELQEINQLLRRGGWALLELPGVTRIEVDPDRLSGQPTIRDRRIAAEKVARIAQTPNGPRVLSTGYDISKREAADAVQWYKRAQQLAEVPGHILHTPGTVKQDRWSVGALGVLAANLGWVRNAGSYSRSSGQRLWNRSQRTRRVRAGEQLETRAISIQESQLAARQVGQRVHGGASRRI